MNIHPDILVHWSDRRWAGQEITDQLRCTYVQRLRSFYQNHLWLTDQSSAPEIIRGAFGATTQVHTGSILCFTELRLSLVHNHIAKFGSLGIGFRRDFLMRRGANPVFYVQNDDTGVVNTNVRRLVAAAERDPSLALFTSYLKAMSKEKGGCLKQYDELEWRCVDCSVGNNGERPYPVRNGHPTLAFEPKDIVLVVFPDRATREVAERNEDIKPFFDQHRPMMMDATEIGNL